MRNSRIKMSLIVGIASPISTMIFPFSGSAFHVNAMAALAHDSGWPGEVNKLAGEMTSAIATVSAGCEEYVDVVSLVARIRVRLR